MTRLQPIVLIILLYGVLAGRYTLVVPLFEAPDEYYHFAVIEHLARTGEMPPRVVAPLTDYQFSPTPWRQMTYHAPLYYRLVAGAVRALGISTHDFAQYRLNPHAQVGIARAADNVNVVAHLGGPSLLGIPQRDPTTDTGAAVRVGRVISLALGALTLAAAAALGWALVPARPVVAVLATAIIALTPQFLFLAGVVSNDALLTTLCAWLLVAVAWYTLPGPFPRRAAAVLLVLLPAFASLSKASGLATVPLAGGALLLAAWQGRTSWRRALALCAALVAVFALVAAPWYLENARLLGDMTATSRIAEATGLRGSVPFTLEEARGLYYSFWGVFGWFNVTPADAFFAWTAVLCAGGAAGAAAGRRTPPAVWALYGGYTLVIAAAWWSFNSQTYAAQGRLFYPLLPLMAVGLAWGWAQWPRPLRWPALGVLLAGMLAAAAHFPAALIQPAYTPSLAAHTPPSDAAAFHYREPWQEKACLTLWVTPPAALPPPGQALTLHLAWRAECPVGGYWSVFVHVADPARQTCQPGDNQHVLAQADSMPQGGRLPLPALPLGAVVADSHTVIMPTAAQALAVQVGLYDAAGTFMRAFATPVASPAPGARAALSRCGPEIIQISAEPGTGEQ
jgi:hypothetical protein